ncbi:conserved Plasmodium protein, unknown function [Plasmodium yoelii]|uniref:PH domain-containing protein n=2 Tax=Plasmodium yoelii TaxID=5861 RepID=A0AAE9WYE5_PLAYO|nr:conserved Plasmodium protein, unknown function [Plasmodium yoelii]WBY60785.1 hypothetical protein Py17XNL_001401055 [Plasmodium yoelii yoelii]CDU20560.1 conserved Plasmodium protein, unknown function [Plasmodium yoelii]VTZ81521.1 conserved Plasmodium protein, unknown function [Plasmodium yoelii]|eukprot:XP_022812879.1 conserved Plasmodium protein, unknown function [Plasmodium yoelii]
MEEKNVLEYAEVIIDRQRDKINDLEKKLIELRSKSEELQKSAVKNDEENKNLRLELNRKNDNDVILSMQLNKENEFLQKISILEKQLLKRDTLLEELNNLLKKRKHEYEVLLQEKENLINTISMLRSDVCKNRKNDKLKEQELLNNEKENENLLNLYKNNNEELNITKRCLIQIESELHLYKKQNENQKNEIQKLYKIISCMNKEKILAPPIVLALQNDYAKYKKYGYVDEYTKNGALIEAPSQYNAHGSVNILSTDNTIMKGNKSTTLKRINENDPQGNISCDENLLKLNIIQSQEQKALFNKILDTLNKAQDNQTNFFFSSMVLHYFQKQKKKNSIYSSSASIDNTVSNEINFSENSSTISSSDDSLEKERYSKREKNKNKENEKDRENKKKKNTQYDYSSKKYKNKSNNLKKKRNQVSSKYSNTNSTKSYIENDYAEGNDNSNNDNKYNNSEDSIDSFNSSLSDSYQNDDDHSQTGINEMNSNNVKNKYNAKKNDIFNYENYKEKYIGITRKGLFIYNKKGDEEPIHIILSKNTKNVKMLDNNQIYCFEHTTLDNKREKHYFLIKDGDKYLRMFYALQYADFIKNSYNNVKNKNKTKYVYNEWDNHKYDGRKKFNKEHERTNIKKNNNKYEDDSDSKTSYSAVSDITVNIFTPNGIDKKGNHIPYVCNNVLLKANPNNNHLLLINFGENSKIINCKDYKLKCKNNKIILYFNNLKDQHILIPKNKRSTKTLQNILTKMVWEKKKKKDDAQNSDNNSANSYLNINNDVSQSSVKMSNESDSKEISDNIMDREIDKDVLRETKKKGKLKSKELSIEKEQLTHHENVNKNQSKNDNYQTNHSKSNDENKNETESEKDADTIKSNTLSNMSDSSKQNETFAIKNKTLYICKDGKPFKKNQTSYNEENAFAFHNDNLQILQDDKAQELTFINKKDNGDEETYVFHYPMKNKYDHILSQLNKNKFNIVQKSAYDKIKQADEANQDEENKKVEDINTGGNPLSNVKIEAGLYKKQKEDQFIKNNQIVVIEKGLLLIYTNYGNENSVPILKYTPDACEVIANDQNREISIKDTTSISNEKIVLDCLNKTEFYRWKSALCFGGFIKGETVNTSLMNLKKHIFSINLFDDPNMKSLIKTERDFIYIYPDEKMEKPLFSFNKDKIELVIFPDLRKIRVYLQRDTIYEQRYDILVPLARDFANIKSQIEKYNYYTLSQKKTQKIKKPFVLCKTNIIAIHKNKYKLMPEIIMKKKNTTVTFDKKKLTIIFNIKNEADNKHNETKTITLSNEINFNKWIVTLKIASFISGYTLHENYMAPSITFGHTCPEATSLFRKRSIFESIFRKKS